MANTTNKPENTRGEKGLSEGSKAPDFTLPDQNGNPVRLSDKLSQSNVVLYFYPKDDTPGCTTEACGFRDSYTVFQEAGAEVIGVSADSVEAHTRFAAKHHLPFTLLSDTDSKVSKQYGVAKTFGLLPGRVTFIISQDGIIKLTFSSQFNPMSHITQALDTLRKLDQKQV